MHVKDPAIPFVLCRGHNYENTLYALCMSATVWSRGHPGLSIDNTFVGPGEQEHMDFLFKITGMAASTFYSHTGV